MKDENEEQPMKKKTEKKPKPIEDMALGVVRVQYTTQGLKEPHREVGAEGRPVPANEFLGAEDPGSDNDDDAEEAEEEDNKIEPMMEGFERLGERIFTGFRDSGPSAS
ncbi:hypothetical protein AK812_SmicGene36156 [Symbiodinium microadriaticum]|uniref:Uncharacterized protein n=1 Tax=Symbiodinium microadriaticum TaxID=2951 RepID=A0A1Q9CJN5_SYMMI|nr:hypothetical protein AK812_SmicGene36156 [Symbiodinium microadriaticum]